MRGIGQAIAIGTFAALCVAASAEAQTVVGTITVCYYSANCPYTETRGFSGPVDAPAFLFTNTTSQTITMAKFTIMKNTKNGVLKDTFAIGKIKPNASFVLIPGSTADKKSRTDQNLLFYYYGADSPRDTSDQGPDADPIKFVFNGWQGSAQVTSGEIVVGATAGTSNDGTVSHLNFLGGPDGADGPCLDCFGPLQIATISTVAAARQ